MRRLIVFVGVAVFLVGGREGFGAVSLRFDPNDIFNFATTDDTRLNQQGTARRIWDSPTGIEYLSYNDGTRDPGATASGDLQSVASIIGWTGNWAGYQGVSHVQLWLKGGISTTWGELILPKPGTTLSATVNGEYGWTATVSSGIVQFNTVLGGTPDTQNAISPGFNPADELWEVFGDFYVDVNGDSSYDPAVDTDVVVGQEYTIWFNAPDNNWLCEDAYGNTAWGNPDFEGTLRATATPEPASLVIWLGILGGLGLGYVRRRGRRNAA